MYDPTRRFYAPAAKWVRFRFVSEEYGATAGFAMKASMFYRSQTADLTRCFPLTDLPKFETLQVSPEFDLPEEAHAFRFDGEDLDA